MSESVPQESKSSKLALEPFPADEKSKCPHINKKGDREGLPCDRNNARGEKYCSTHLKDQSIALELQETQKLAKQEGKVSVTIEPVKKESIVKEPVVKEPITIIPLYPTEKLRPSPPPDMHEELIL